MATLKCTITLPKEMLEHAIKQAALQRRRAATAAAVQYGTDHIMAETLRQEEAAFLTAISTITEG